MQSYLTKTIQCFSCYLKDFLSDSQEIHSGHPPPFLKGGLSSSRNFKKGGGLKYFWIKGGLSLKEGERGVKISRGGWIPGHNFQSISNFIFSFSQQMTLFFLFPEVKMRNLVYCFNVTSTFLIFNLIFFNTQCNLHKFSLLTFVFIFIQIQY